MHTFFANYLQIVWRLEKIVVSLCKQKGKGLPPSSNPKQSEKDMKEHNTFRSVRELAKVMKAEAQRVAAMYGNALPVSDWATEWKTIAEIMRDNKRYGNEYPYIIAFRAMGCEGGTRREVVERCEALGGAVSVWSIRYDLRAGGFTLTREA